MAYDEGLAARVRSVLSGRREVAERRMFGGVAFLIGGRLIGGVVGRDLLVRVGPDRHAEALGRPGARPMDFTGRPMRGLVFVGPAGTRGAISLEGWLDLGARYAASLEREARRGGVAKGRRRQAPRPGAPRRRPRRRGRSRGRA
jgi:hypothetical protein